MRIDVARLKSYATRAYFLWRMFSSRLASLKARAKVEQRLLDAANGKAPVPTAEECRELALTLGDPARW